ncbi:MAG: PAS domain S-box protein [Candidatus Zixiibacteriota bacterium]
MKNKPTYKELEKELSLFKDLSNQNKLDYEGLLHLVNTAPVGLIVVNQRIIEYVNDRFCELLGYGAKELIGHSTEICYSDKEEFLRVGKELYSQIKKFGFGNIVAKAKRKEGELFDVIISTSLVDPDNREGSIIFSVIDITNLKRTRQLMAESRRSKKEMEKIEALLMAAIEQTPAGVLIADAPDVRIRLANSAALGIRGLSVKPLTDISVEAHPGYWQTYYPDGTPFKSEDLPLSRAILEGVASRNVEVIIKRHDGSDRWVLANAAPVRDKNGNIIAGVVVFPDITEIKVAQERLKLALVASRSGVWEWDVKSNELYWDNALKNIYGIEPDKFDGQFKTYLKAIHPHDRELIENYISRVIRHGDIGDHYNNEHRIIKPDGSIGWIQNTGRLSRDQSGAILKVVGIASDVTERKRAESMLLSIVEGTSKETGRNFFRKLVRHLAEALDCEYSIVGILESPDAVNINSLAFWDTDKIGKNFDYLLAGSPCENVVGKRLCLYNSGVYNEFPLDKWLAKNKIESYLGIPLFNISDKPIGILAVMGKKPFPMDIVDNARSLLTIFASRAEAELQRIMADDELLALTETLRKERQELSEKNVALRQVLDLMEQEKMEFKYEISTNIDNALTPFIKKIKRSEGTLSKKDVGLLDDAVKSIVGREMDNFRANYGKLTSREIDICELINKGMTSQEIADNLNISLQTVQKHRSSIRKKLQLKNKEINLSAYLRTKNM